MTDSSRPSPRATKSSEEATAAGAPGLAVGRGGAVYDHCIAFAQGGVADDLGLGVVADARLHGDANLHATCVEDVNHLLAALGTYSAVGHQEGIGALGDDS